MAGVIAISIMMTIAAAGLLAVSANSRNDGDMSFRRHACYLDAESGLMLGVGWLRKQGADFIKTPCPGWPPSGHPFPKLPLDNHSSVTVTIIDNVAVDPSNQTKTVVSRAVLGTDSIQFSWDIGVDPLNTDPTKPTLTLNNWRVQP